MNKPLKYPIGIQDFAKLREGDYLYIDKTQALLSITQNGTYYFLSRPRRFGKSLLTTSLLYLYQGRKDLFDGLYIAERWDFSQTNPVLYFPLNNYGTMQSGLTELLQNSLHQQAAQYGISLPDAISLGQSFSQLIEALHKKTGRKVVVLIDEYDKPIIDFLDEPNIAAQNRTILKGFYGILKPADPHLELVFLTGISRFAKVSIFSDLNNLDDITLQEDYGTMLGITQTELEHYFAEPLVALAARHKLAPDDFLQKVKTWYNGYRWNNDETVYNPFSILNFFKNKGEFKNYWFASGTPTFLVKDLEQKEIHELTKIQASVFSLESFEIETMNPITLLYQAGYLTIVGVDRSVCTLDFPNQEVRESFTILMLDHYRGGNQDSIIFAQAIGDAFQRNDLKTVFEGLNSLFSTIPNNLWESRKEKFYHALTHLTFRLLGVHVKSEVNTSRGRCDALVETDKYVYALEFKLNGDAKAALHQVHDKGYLQPYALSGKELIAIGVNFTTEAKGVSEWVV